MGSDIPGPHTFDDEELNTHDLPAALFEPPEGCGPDAGLFGRCRRCGDESAGSMTRCSACGATFHSTCVKAMRRAAAGASAARPGEPWYCEECEQSDGLHGQTALSGQAHPDSGPSIDAPDGAHIHASQPETLGPAAIPMFPEPCPPGIYPESRIPNPESRHTFLITYVFCNLQTTSQSCGSVWSSPARIGIISWRTSITNRRPRTPISSHSSHSWEGGRVLRSSAAVVRPSALQR